MLRRSLFALLLVVVGLGSSAAAGEANRLAYLDEFCEPYYAHLGFAKLVTPQWVGEPGVEAVVTLGIDDMRDPAKYEAYLRPILERLKEIDGRAAVSIMTNGVDPHDPQLQAWLKEGVSLETHTADHPCPCLQGGDFGKAKRTYDECVDLLAKVPNSRPVAFRFPCMDSLNTPSPRGFAEIINQTTPDGNFLQISTSVTAPITPDDPDLPRELVVDADGRPRFTKYIPFPSFVNKVENYPYPFVIGRLCWEFPCQVPDDWQGQNLNQPNNPKTVEDIKASIDAVVLKRGTANLVFHPHGWIRNQQMVEVIDHVAKKHGSKVRFLNFRECLERLNEHLLCGQPLRAEDGGDNGVRLLDLNGDGFLDVVIGNDELQRTRIWSPQEGGKWIEFDLPTKLVTVSSGGERRLTGVRFGILNGDQVVMFVANEKERGAWRFTGEGWAADATLLQGLELDGEPVLTARNGRDTGLRLRDLDGDGTCELVVGGVSASAVFAWSSGEKQWARLDYTLPEGTALVDAQGRDAGLRFVDIDEDGHDDVIFSNEERYSLHLYQPDGSGWSRQVRAGKRGDAGAIPMISRGGTNNGAWFAARTMWIQNEDTNRLPDGVDRRSFIELLGDTSPAPKTPEASLKSIKVRPGFRVELVAAEPLVMDPVAFDWGPDGKLWVVEMADYPLGLDDKGQPGGRVRYLEDTDGDGQYDKSTLFLDGLNFPTGVLVWRKGVLISAAPDILYAEDTDGDGRADRREVLYTGFGEGNQQHRVNGFWRGLDNWIHVANGDSGGKIRSVKTGTELAISGRDLRIRPDEGAVQAQTGMTQFGRARDDWGNWFGCNNSNPVFHFVTADQYFSRNPHVAAPAGVRHICTVGNTGIYPISRVMSHWSGYKPPAAGEPSLFTSANGITIYRDDLFGPQFELNAFVSEPIHNLIHRQVLRPEGVSFTGGRAIDEERSEFLASSDSWFRPTSVRTGPDGALWVADMYRIVLEHPQWIDDEEEKRLNLREGHDKGRIYRIVPVDREPRAIPRLDRLDVPELVAALDSPSGWQRDLAQQMLVWRGGSQVIVPLAKLATTAERPETRLHALCTLEGLNGLTAELLAAALADPHPGVRRHAVRLAEGLINDNSALEEALLKRLADTDAHVQLQLAYSLGAWNDSRAGRALGELAVKHAGDQYLLAASLSSLNQANVGDALAAVLAANADEQVPAELLERLFTLATTLGDEQTLGQAIVQISQPAADGRFARWQFRAFARIAEALARRDTSLEQLLKNESVASVKRLYEQAGKLVGDAEAELDDRIAALQLLAGATQDVELIGSLLAPQNPPQLQQAGVQALSRMEHAKVPEQLLSGWAGYVPALRGQIIEVLLSRPAWTEQLLASIATQEIMPSQLDTLTRQRLTGHADAKIAERARALLTMPSDASRQQVVEQYQSVAAMSGLAERGQMLFRKHCAACHQLEGVGHAVGPDLAALTNKSPQALLVAILDPNRAIEDKFVDYALITTEGRILNGLLAAEAASSITLRGQEGKEQVVLRQEIDELRSTGKSLMPEGFEKDLAPQDLADMIAYLAQTGPAPKKFPGNEPALVKANDSGMLELAARLAKVYGTSLVYEPTTLSLEYWSSLDDRAAWTIEVPKAGTYAVQFDYSCDDGSAKNTFVVQIAAHELTGAIAGTGSWQTFKQVNVGQVELAAGTHVVTIFAAPGLKHALMDLRTIRLVPVEKK